MTRSNYSTALIAIDAVVVDTETTGLDARTARIVQIAAMALREGAIIATETFETLVDPGVPIPSATTAIHGIRDEDVKGQPTFAAVAPQLDTLLNGRIMIGYAVGYDQAMFEREYGLAGLAKPRLRTLDIRTLARLAAPSLADHSLERICEWLQVPIHGRHSARGDAEATAAAYLALLPRLRAKGIRTLAEAEAASRKLAEREAQGSFGEPAAAETSVLERIDSFPYRHRLADIMSSPPLVIDRQASVREAIGLILARSVSSVFVKRDNDWGIVTERDLLRAIDGGNESGLARPVEQIASFPLQTVKANDFVYRAIGRIERLGIRHLGVVADDGMLVGAVTTRNLLRHRATTAIALGDEIDRAPSAAALAAAWSALPRMTRSLLAEDVDALLICNVVSAEICAMTRRAAELAELDIIAEGRGAPPVDYAVLVLGSAGRGESQLAADQDNAIVFADSGDDAGADAYFERLGARMADILDQAGVPYCKGGVMAKSSAWRRSVTGWKQTIDGWVRRQSPKDLLSVDIFFDSVPVHGRRELGDEVWTHAYTRAHAARDFQVLLTEAARAPANAFTLFGGFRVDGAGRLDVKRYGLMPIFTAARVLSIRHGVRVRPSGERLRGVAAAGAASSEIVESIVDAQHVLLGAVLGQQLIDLEAGVPPSTRVVPSRMDSAARTRLKSALKAVEEAGGLVGEGRL